LASSKDQYQPPRVREPPRSKNIQSLHVLSFGKAFPVSASKFEETMIPKRVRQLVLFFELDQSAPQTHTLAVAMSPEQNPWENSHHSSMLILMARICCRPHSP